MEEQLKKAIFSRYNQHGIKFNTWDELKQATKITDEQEVICFYCKQPLLAQDNYPYRRIVSLDHKTPKCKNGANTIENTCLSCTECNIIKGTMTAPTYFLFLKILNQYPAEKKIIFEELFWGKRKAKIEQEKKELMLWELV